jgi:stage II sporulation protein D
MNSERHSPQTGVALVSPLDMIAEEPLIKVGIIAQCRKVDGAFNGPYRLDDERSIEGSFAARISGRDIILHDTAGNEIVRQKEIHCTPIDNSTFTLFDVTIGVHFHWERTQEQTFKGTLILVLDELGNLVVINQIFLEDYLASVVSSEMSTDAPLEFLKAHSIISRSWLMATLTRARAEKKRGSVSFGPARGAGEISCWYDRKDHELFDVCADDHCQRYQGVTRMLSGNARNATETTKGVFLTHNNEICDARYHKACGGITDHFQSAWDDTPVPYLTSVSDSPALHDPIRTEADAERWFLSIPDAYCNTREEHVLRQILPSFDRETTDFFRWKVMFTRKTLEGIISEKSGLDFGELKNIIPRERGPSGRIVRLTIEGSKQTITIGKELEIRRWLSRTHLLSSAFSVTVEHDQSRIPARFILHGAGWGHGVGLCQIGAAVMASRGSTAEEILKHYFRDTQLQKLY